MKRALRDAHYQLLEEKSGGIHLLERRKHRKSSILSLRTSGAEGRTIPYVRQCRGQVSICVDKAIRIEIIRIFSLLEINSYFQTQPRENRTHVESLIAIQTPAEEHHSPLNEMVILEGYYHMFARQVVPLGIKKPLYQSSYKNLCII